MGEDFDAGKAAAAGRAEYERRKAAMNASNPENINNSSVSGKSMRAAQAQTKPSSGQDKGTLQAQSYDPAIFGKPTKDAAGKVMLIFGILGDALFGFLSIC